MSKKHKRKAARLASGTGEAYFAGSALDQICEGGITREIRGQLYHAQQAALPTATLVEQLAVAPLHCVMFRNFCRNCGASHDTFGYLTRKVTEDTPEGSLTRYKAVASPGHGECPASVESKLETVPFCPTCILITP